MRAATIISGALLLALVLAKVTNGSKRPRLTYAGAPIGGTYESKRPRLTYAGAPIGGTYRYNAGYGNKGYYNPRYGYRNGYGYGSRYGYRNYYGNNYGNYYGSPYVYPYYQTGYYAPCGGVQSCPQGYSFSIQYCVCVSAGKETGPDTSLPTSPDIIPELPRPPCSLAATSCFQLQTLNLTSCACECQQFILFKRGGRPVFPGRRFGRKSRSRSSSDSRRKRDVDEIEELLLEAGDQDMELARVESHKSRSSSHSSSRGRRRPAVTTTFVKQCPLGTAANLATCTCSKPLVRG